MRTLLVSVLTLAAACTFCPPAVVRAEDPTTQHTVIDASDKKAIDESMGKDVIITGQISTAAWSSTGKVMNIEFVDARESRLLAVVFERNREKLDEMFNGDLAKALTGAKVRLMGTLQEYGGKSEAWKGRPQIIIDRPSQITIVEPAKE
jgi:DNA/RNA endonuclease YhcR with UshA esterase domain